MKQNDLKRGIFLKDLGYTIVRYTNDDVVVNPSWIIEDLQQVIKDLQTR